MSHRGWFDSFRDHGGVILYSSINRTPAIEDVRNVLIYVTFTTLFVAFLIIFPGIRKERISTFISVSVSLFIGAVILVANCGTSWHVAHASISSPYRAFSTEKIFADVTVKVGLQSVNITLKAKPIHKHFREINYNERFYWIGATEMKQEYQNALRKGLPFPILTIAEYLSQTEEGFCWGRRYRLAGYYSNVLLWFAFSVWILMNILLCAVPRYGVFTMQITGVVMLIANAVYTILLPSKTLVIPFEGENLRFTYGWCFWMVLGAGIVAVLVGASVTIVDTIFPNKFSTILEVDYDTPYRYFVGNDAHLFGGLGLKCQHSCETSTTCCNSSVNSKLSKRKSDASTSTVMSIPVKKPGTNNNNNNNSLTCTLKAKAAEKFRAISGFIHSSTTSTAGATCVAMRTFDRPSTASTVVTEAVIERHSGVENTGYLKDEENDSDSSDVSTTIIDGKRAVSLANFAKFQRQQTIEAQKEGKSLPGTPGTNNPALWY